ncbi:hypothetical protein D9M68_561410 [compost metagenome]
MSLKDVVDLILALFRFGRAQSNPVRKQAARILQAFEVHGIACTQINPLLPEHLRLPAIAWSNADELKTALTQAHIEWISHFFALEPEWLAGVSDEANEQVFSYKSPAELHCWFEEHKAPEQALEFKLHLITADEGAITPRSSGYFAVVLEQFIENGNNYQSRLYQLSAGAHFDHYPCLLHLMQILAMAHFHGAIMDRSRLAPSELAQLSKNEGLIAGWLNRCKPHRLEADHEFWGHFSGSSHWLEQLRQDAEQSLLMAGLNSVVEKVRQDRKRFARPQSATTNHPIT